MTDAKHRSSMKEISLPVDVRDAVEEVSPTLDAHDSDMKQFLIMVEKMKITEHAAVLPGQTYILQA